MKLLVNTPKGTQEIIEVSESGGYFDEARILWDERIDGPLPDITLGGMVRVADKLVFDQVLKDAYDLAYTAKTNIEQWQADMQALDAEGVTRPIEDIIDSMDAEQLARLDPFLRDVHTRKKAKRNQKPA